MIDKQYGPGGIYDLSTEQVEVRNRWGRGTHMERRAIANQDAQELYRLTHGATQWDREHSGQAAVDWDINRIKQLRENLSKGGLMPADQTLAAIEEHTKNTSAALTLLQNKLAKNGAIPVALEDDK
jgi:hypothetical protein